MRSFCLPLNFAFLFEQVFAEVDEGLCGFGNITVLFPSKTDIDKNWIGERDCLDTWRVFDYHI